MTITCIIIGLTVLISMTAFSNDRMMKGLMMNPYLIRNKGEYYRFLTSGFIHKDHMHLGVNMFSFYFFGSAIERVFSNLFGTSGSYYFIALYLLAITVSDLPTYFKQYNNPHYNSLGASGGIAAIIFAFILFEPLQLIYIYFAVPIPGFILGVL
jgi:membrane associated rhomboid family serine protease